MNSIRNKPPKVLAFLICMLWIPVILFCAHLIISGRKGSSFSFILLCLLLVCILLAVKWLSKYFEHASSEIITSRSRIGKQFFYGFLSPLFILVILAAGYDTVIDDGLIIQSHFIKELSIFSMFFYVANSFFLVISLDKQFSLVPTKMEETENYNEKIVVYHKGAYVPINLMEIALIYQMGQINWIITFKEEEHILDLSLKAIQEIISAEHFFKINRSQIVHKDAIDKFSAGPFGKINVVLKFKNITSTVSKDRAKDFRNWFYK